MTIELTLKKALAVLSIALVGVAGLALAGAVYRQNHRPWPATPQLQARLLQPGSASAPVQEEVRTLLRSFEAGYALRDPDQLDRFMAAHFDPGADLLILGTDSVEWVRGFAPAREFIHNDWLGWGSLHLDVDHAIVSANGQTAWLATMGTVDYSMRFGRHFVRPLRLTAVLVRGASGWRFRQVQFQWEG